MFSIPEALLDGIDEAIMPFISLLSVQLKENCSHVRCCLGDSETMLVKIVTMLVSQGFNLVYSVLTNGHKKINKRISDRFIISVCLMFSNR